MSPSPMITAEQIAMSSSAKIDIVVKNEGRTIGHRPGSPVRKLPDGTAGIVVNGLVFAIHKDHSVDLAEVGIPKADCPEFFRPDEDLVYAAIDDSENWWFFEQTSRGAYLALDGSEEFAERLNAAFEDEGLSRGCRKSFRPAKNGYFYDYYIRLPSYVGEDEVRRVIAKVVTATRAPDANEAAEEILKRLVEYLGGPRQFVQRWTDAISAKSKLEEEIASIREAALRKAQRLERTASDLENERKGRGQLISLTEDLRSKNERLEEQLRTIKEAARGGEISWEDEKSREIDRLQGELEILQRDLSNSREEIELSKLEKKELEEQFDEANRELEALRSQMEILKAEQRPTVPLPINQANRSKRERQILHDLITGAFPRLVLRNQDFEAMLEDFRSLSECARFFMNLQEHRWPQGIKKWQSIEGLFEIPDVDTGIPGRQNMGRIYFKKLPGDEGRIEVAVHVKRDENEQRRFVNARFG